MRSMPRVHIHLRQGCHQGPFRTLVALEQLGREAAGAVLRNPELKLADPRDQGAAVMAGAVAEPLRCALAPRSAKRLLHLGFENFPASPRGSLRAAALAVLPSVLVMAAFFRGNQVTLNITSLP